MSHVKTSGIASLAGANLTAVLSSEILPEPLTRGSCGGIRGMLYPPLKKQAGFVRPVPKHDTPPAMHLYNVVPSDASLGIGKQVARHITQPMRHGIAIICVRLTL